MTYWGSIFYEPSELAAIAFIFKNIGKENPQLYSKTVALFNELHEKVSHSIYKQSSIEDILSIKKDEFYVIKNAIEDKKEMKFKFHSYDKYVQPLKIGIQPLGNFFSGISPFPPLKRSVATSSI